MEIVTQFETEFFVSDAAGSRVREWVPTTFIKDANPASPFLPIDIDDVSADISTTGRIWVNGETIEQDMDGIDDSDWFAFNVGSAQTVNFLTNARKLARGEISFHIYDADGNEIGIANYVSIANGLPNPAIRDIVQYHFAEPGEYFFEVRIDGNGFDARYFLSAEQVDPGTPQPISTATSILNAASIQRQEASQYGFYESLLLSDGAVLSLATVHGYNDQINDLVYFQIASPENLDNPNFQRRAARRIFKSTAPLRI